MTGSSSKVHKTSRASRKGEIQITPLIDLLEEQDEAMRVLFAKALNLYISPGADTASESEKLDRLKQAIEDSLGSSTP
jgi:hypothetical protein